MDTRKIPPIVTLTAGLVAAIVTYMGHYELNDSLKILLGVLVGFYIFGSLIKFLFDKMGMSDIAMKEKEEAEHRQAALEAAGAGQQEEENDTKLENEDGSVIEKEAENQG